MKILGLIVIVIILAVILCLLFLGKRKIKKKFFYDEYGVKKPTFIKWLKEFNYDLWVHMEGKKQCSPREAFWIYYELGIPSTDTRIINKGQLADTLSIEYCDLKARVLKYSDKIGITESQYKKLSSFPPRIIENIICYCSKA